MGEPLSIDIQPEGIFPKNRRRESRHPLRAAATVERRSGGRLFGSTINVSGSGVLLDLPQGGDLQPGEEVGCSIQLYAGKPPQAWGVGKVVRVERSLVAIEFTGLDWTP
jgi:hypothetical protein